MRAEAFFPRLIARYRSLRIAPGSRLLCRRSPTKCVPARSSGVRAPSTLGTFLRSFTHGHVEQLDAVGGRLLAGLTRQIGSRQSADTTGRTLTLDPGARPLQTQPQVRGGRAVARDEFGDRLGNGGWVRGDREVIATLEDDLLALREQLVEGRLFTRIYAPSTLGSFLRALDPG